MKKFLRGTAVLMSLLAFVLVAQYSAPVKAANIDGYVALDSSNPIEFDGTYIVYNGQTITLGPKAIYVDGSLSQSVADKYTNVYTSITAALSATALTNGTQADPMTVYVAPYVYWIDNPDATDTVEKTTGYSVPYGMVVNCDWLKITGLTTDPYNVIIAGNRGQSNGSNGNYTMFHFNGNGLNLNNVTIGNYCSIDLTYPLKPALNHARRTQAITQAQLGDVNGDKVAANNCNFISRLNLDPLGGGTRTLYNKCHFESTDDSLNGNAVYLDCDFDFYGNRPFYSTSNTGAALLNCQFNSLVLNVEAEPAQYFTKEGGTVTAVDSNYTSNFSIPFSIAWTKYPLKSLRCYQYNIKHNNSSIIIAGADAEETVDMTGKSVLDAYRIVYNGTVYYNTYNLLRGTDNWDPMNVKSIIEAAGVADGKDYTTVPTMLTVSTSATSIESGVTTATLSSKVQRFDGTLDSAAVIFSLSTADQAYATLTDNGNGTYTLTGINAQDDTKDVTVYAATSAGLEGAVAVSVKPTILAAPTFISNPVITNDGNGKLRVNYTLDLQGRSDQSVISWYRCADASGTNPMLVAVSRMNQPENEYTLTLGDMGYYMKAVVEPKSIRSNPGTGVTAVYLNVTAVADVKVASLQTDFSDFPTIPQTSIIPGFWTVDCFRPADTSSYSSWGGNTSVNPWAYGITGNGSIGSGLYQATQGARLMYTPITKIYGDMSLKLVIDPAKTAGQGFGSAGQYMDVCIKFDTTTLTGYGLRIIRTTAASNASTFVLVKYENGQTTEISQRIISSCFATGCQISLKVEGGKFTVHVETPTAQLADQTAAGFVHTVDLSADIETNDFGGIAIQHTGTTGSGGWQNTTMLHNLTVNWAGNEAIVTPVVDEIISANPQDTIAVDGIISAETQDTIVVNDSVISSTAIQTGDRNRMNGFIIVLIITVVAEFGIDCLEIIAKRCKSKVDKN